MYRPIEIVDTPEEWSVQENPARFRRSRRPAKMWTNFSGLEVKVALIRAPNYDPAERFPVRASIDVFRFMQMELRDDPNEGFYVVIVDNKHMVTGVHQVSRGTSSDVPVHPVDVMRPVLASGNNAFIVVHNHPSGNPEPSREDALVTERLKQAAEVMGMVLLDHLVMGYPNTYVSLADRGIL